MKFKDDARSRLHETSDRDCDNIPSVVSKIDHDVRSWRRKLVLSLRCLWLPFGDADKRGAEDVMTTSFAPTFLACGGIFVLSFVAIGAFWFVERLRGASAPHL